MNTLLLQSIGMAAGYVAFYGIAWLAYHKGIKFLERVANSVVTI